MQYIHCSELAFIHLAMYFSCHSMGLTHSSRSCIGYQITCYYGYNHSHIDGYLVFLSLFVLSNSILTNIWIFLCVFISVYVELIDWSAIDIQNTFTILEW